MIESELLSRKFIEGLGLIIEYTELPQFIIEDLSSPHRVMTERDSLTGLDKRDD